MKLDLSSKKINIEINQLYHSTGKFKTDFYGDVYSKDTLNKTKFVPILLKEWFYLVKKGGILVIDYIPNKICDKEKLKSMMDWLWKGNYKIVSHDYIDNQRLRFICKKIADTTFKNDDMSKWTFGIITNGKRVDWVEQIIKSIRQQKIPHYEIIICGTYKDKGEKDIIYIPFNLKDDKGWITKKKNLIVKSAKYENICMLHDRMILGEGWYKGMQKWGNCFENLGCIQVFDGQRVNDWITSHYFIKSKNGEKFSFESYVDYRDWYPNIWFMGQLNIFKKSNIVKNNLWWDEKLFYGEREDYDFSLRLYKKGFIPRFSNLAEVETLTDKYLNPTFIKYDPNSFMPNMELNNRNAFLKLSSYLILKLLNLLGIKLTSNTLENIRGKIYTFILMLHPLKYDRNREWRNTSQ